MSYPLFKGATRAAVVAGVPLVPLMLMLIGVALIMLVFGLAWALLALPAWLVMAVMTRFDDRAFRVLGLWLETKAKNLTYDRRWQASSYAPADYRQRRPSWAQKP
jgi:type IV secretion system protein VirB3